MELATGRSNLRSVPRMSCAGVAKMERRPYLLTREAKAANAPNQFDITKQISLNLE